jgi:FkbM family methyltransferase
MNLTYLSKYFIPENVLDIGGHTGEFYSEIKSVYSDSQVYIIEGNKDCEPFLKTLNTRYRISLMSKNEKEIIYYKTKKDPLCTGNSIYREITDFFSDENIIQEKRITETIDGIFFGKEKFDLIKVDTQGSELDILTGGKKVIEEAKGIILEVSFTHYNNGAPLYAQVVEFMNSNNFIEREVLDQSCYCLPSGPLLQRDILFVSKNILKV